MKVLCLIGVLLGALAFNATNAQAMSQETVLSRLQIACPMVRPTRYRNGRLDYTVEPRKVDEARDCLRESFWKIVRDPWPVNKSGVCEATHIRTLPNGRIDLYNPNCRL